MRSITVKMTPKRRTFFKRTFLAKIALLSLLLCNSGYAADALYIVIGEIPDDNDQDAGIRIQFGVGLIDNAPGEGLVFNVPLPDGTTGIGEVIGKTGVEPVDADSLLLSVTSTSVISLQDRKGGVELHYSNSSLSGMTVYESDGITVYRTEIDGNGRGMLASANIDAHNCDSFPVAPPETQKRLEARAATPPSLTQLMNLESRPGAARTVYINYWGGSLSGTAWNNNFICANNAKVYVLAGFRCCADYIGVRNVENSGTGYATNCIGNNRG